jgi:hypothetical protein
MGRARLVGVVALALVGARAARAQTPPVDAPAPEGDASARAESQAAAALRAAQELEVQLVELRRDLDAFARERASYDDLRRRMDALDARRAEARTFGDWASLSGGGDGVRFVQNGFVVRSPDNRFSMRPGLRFQALYEGAVAHGVTPGQPAPDLSTLRLAHAELLFEGHAVSQRFEYRFELDFADPAASYVKDAFVQWRFGHDVALRAGRFFVPFGLQARTWNGFLELVDVAQPTAAFGLDRDVGLAVVGRPLAGRLQYQLAVMNGPRACPIKPTSTLACDTIDLAYGARIVAAPFGPPPLYEGALERHSRPAVSVGGSIYYGLVPTDARARMGNAAAPLDVDGDFRVDNVGVWQAAAELRAVWRGASLQAEWLGRREQPGAGQTERTFWGAYAQGSYFVLPRRLQLAARASRGDQPLYGVAFLDRLQRGSRTTEESVAVSYYASGHAAKLQLDYTHRSTPDALAASSEDRVRIAAQLGF